MSHEELLEHHKNMARPILRLKVYELIEMYGAEYTLGYLKFTSKKQCSLVGGELIFVKEAK